MDSGHEEDRKEKGSPKAEVSEEENAPRGREPGRRAGLERGNKAVLELIHSWESWLFRSATSGYFGGTKFAKECISQIF